MNPRPLAKRDISNIPTVVAFCLLAVVLISGLFPNTAGSDRIARWAWEKRRPTIALLAVRKDADLAMRLGNYYFNGGAYELDKAEAAFRKAVRADPRILWGHYQLARIHFVRGEYDSALREADAELGANPENFRTYYVRGLIYGYYPDLKKAEADFREFTRWAPLEWAGYNDLAWILMRQAKYGEAAKAIEQAFVEAYNAGKNPWLWNQLGVAQLNLGLNESAASSFATAGELAGRLTVKDWKAAYPGNDPRVAASGLQNFTSAIEENQKRAAGSR